LQPKEIVSNTQTICCSVAVLVRAAEVRVAADWAMAASVALVAVKAGVEMAVTKEMVVAMAVEEVRVAACLAGA